MKLFRFGLLHLLLVVFLAACGGGGGSAPAATSPPPPLPPPVTSTGVFLDSPVEGLTYQSGSNPPGTTDANGMFSYTVGETLTFSVGGVELGTLPDGAPVITPLDFGAAAENIARFLQTLDADGDPSNGIDLTAAAAALAGTTVGDAVFLSDPITFENDIGPVLEVALGAGAMLIDAATAVANLEAALDSTFDVAELAGNVFVAVFPEIDEIGIFIFAPLLDPGDSGSTVVAIKRSDTLAAGADGTPTVDDWSVDDSGVLSLTNPITLATATIEKAGGSARAISIVVTEGSEVIVGTFLVPTTVTVADLAGESGKTYTVELVDNPDAEEEAADNPDGLHTFHPDGFLIEPDGPDFHIRTWEIDPNGVVITVLDQGEPNETVLFMLVNGSFAIGGDLLVVGATNLSGDPTDPVLQLDIMLEGTLTPLTLAAFINFIGQLDIVFFDNGAAVYSGVPIGTVFSGAIDDVTFTGFISDGTTHTVFGCCIAAGGLSVDNDVALDAADAALLNSIGGTSFAAGDLIDVINLEGDARTSGGGRIEIGLSIILDPFAFDNNSLDNYPPDPDDILFELFFITEADVQGQTIYSALGVLD